MNRRLVAWLALALPAAGFCGERNRTPFIVPPPTPARPFSAAAMEPLMRNLPTVLPREELAEPPFSMVGKLAFRSGRYPYGGSATIVGRKVALTAAHNLWDAKNGWSTKVQFERARFGRTKAGTVRAKELFLYSPRYAAAAERNSSSTAAFAWDVGWITFSRRAAPGGGADVLASYEVMRGDSEKRAMGYGQDFHSGAFPLTVTPEGGFRRLRGGYFENMTYGTEGGMSGGPLFALVDGKWVVVGVVVSGYYDYTGSGVRAVDRGLVRALKDAR